MEWIFGLVNFFYFIGKLTREIILAQKELSQTCVFVISHSLKETGHFCDKLAVMKNANMSLIMNRRELFDGAFKIEILRIEKENFEEELEIGFFEDDFFDLEFLEKKENLLIAYIRTKHCYLEIEEYIKKCNFLKNLEIEIFSCDLEDILLLCSNKNENRQMEDLDEDNFRSENFSLETKEIEIVIEN